MEKKKRKPIDSLSLSKSENVSGQLAAKELNPSASQIFEISKKAVNDLNETERESVFHQLMSAIWFSANAYIELKRTDVLLPENIATLSLASAIDHLECALQIVTDSSIQRVRTTDQKEYPELVSIIKQLGGKIDVS